MSARKYDLEEADRVAAKFGMTRGGVLLAWQEGREPGVNARNTLGAQAEVNLRLAVMRAVGPEYPLSSAAIAEVCGVTKQAIQWIEKRALRKVRHAAWEIRRELEAA